jgi:hypothetical protein
MEVLITASLIEIFLTSAISAHQRSVRQRILEKWVRGELKEAELRWLKKQPWFVRAFKEVYVPKEKKND